MGRGRKRGAQEPKTRSFPRVTVSNKTTTGPERDGEETCRPCNPESHWGGADALPRERGAEGSSAEAESECPRAPLRPTKTTHPGLPARTGTGWSASPPRAQTARRGRHTQWGADQSPDDGRGVRVPDEKATGGEDKASGGDQGPSRRERGEHMRKKLKGKKKKREQSGAWSVAGHGGTEQRGKQQRGTGGRTAAGR